MNRFLDHSVPISLNFTEISLSIESRLILDEVSGKVKPGQVLAIMGPSGSGKTTLLNILAGRINADQGKVLINGKQINKKLKKKIGFVMQEDIFFAHLTLKETLKYSAMLRLPDSLTKEKKMQKVEEIVDTLDIRKCLNTCIGSPLSRGLSGGEKKRANIGCELITNPSILFLDEPTSGLDSSNALNLIKTLKLYAAQEQKTIVMSIHQPSSQIFYMFDKLLLLCNGKIAFYGKAARALDFFESIGLVCEQHFNPADYILEKVTSGSEMEDFIVDSWRKRAEKHQELKSLNLNETDQTLLATDKDSDNASDRCSHEPKKDVETNIAGQERLSESTLSDVSASKETKEISKAHLSDTNLSELSEKSSENIGRVLSKENLSYEGSDSESELLDDTTRSRSPVPEAVTTTNYVAVGQLDSPVQSSESENESAEKKIEILKNGGIRSPRAKFQRSESKNKGVPSVFFKNMATDDVHLDIHDDDDDTVDYDDINTAWVTSFWTQFSVLTERTFKQSKPEILSKISFVQTFLLAVIVGLIWFRIPYMEVTIRDRYALIFFVIVYWNFNPMFSALITFPAERTIIDKERSAGYYRLSAYYFAKLFSELPLVVCQPLGFTIVFYWMCGLNQSVAFLEFVVVVLLTSVAAQSIGLFISATVMDFKQCITIASVFGLSCMLLGGFYQQHIPVWLRWFEHVSYLKYSYEAAVVAEFQTSPPFRCQALSVYESCKNNATHIQGTEVLNHLGITSTFWQNGAFLLGFGILFRALTYLSLRFLHKPK